MSRSNRLNITLTSLLTSAFLHYAKALPPCPPTSFQCMNGICVPRSFFCNGHDDCRDNSDERYCFKSPFKGCPPGWFQCPNELRCIPSHWRCDGTTDCSGISEEKECAKATGMSSVKTFDTSAAKADLKSWFLRRRKPGCRTDRWGSQVHRIAVALHLADNTTFAAGNSTGEEIRYELTIQLLHRLAKDMKMSSQELALYIHALLVACMDPRDFYGDDLVQELRRRVEEAGGYTNPFLILALCNAGDALTKIDYQRVKVAYKSHNRPFWIDSQALAIMAISCIASHSTVDVDEGQFEDMQEELKEHQFRNGTVDNFRTTALVTQAVLINDSYKTDFNLNLALKTLIDGFNGSRSLLKAYYALPVLNRKNLLNVTSAHCPRQPVAEEEALQKTLDANGETITVQYSIWMVGEVNLAKTWRLRMRVNSTIYDAIDTVAKIDNRQKVEYNVVNNKPYVAAVNGKEDDPEMGMFWFIYHKFLTSNDDPKIEEKSPVDVKLLPNQEIILWYKRGPWSSQTLIQRPVTAP